MESGSEITSSIDRVPRMYLIGWSRSDDDELTPIKFRRAVGSCVPVVVRSIRLGRQRRPVLTQRPTTIADSCRNGPLIELRRVVSTSSGELRNGGAPKQEPPGASVDCREGPSRFEPDAMATERCYDAMLKNAMALERCYEAMLKNAMAMERYYDAMLKIAMAMWQRFLASYRNKSSSFVIINVMAIQRCACWIASALVVSIV